MEEGNRVIDIAFDKLDAYAAADDDMETIRDFIFYIVEKTHRYSLDVLKTSYEGRLVNGQAK